MTECKYELGVWGECDGETKERTRIKKLISGDPEKCEAEVRIYRPCLKPNGEGMSRMDGVCVCLCVCIMIWHFTHREHINVNITTKQKECVYLHTTYRFFRLLE